MFINVEDFLRVKTATPMVYHKKSYYENNCM